MVLDLKEQMKAMEAYVASISLKTIKVWRFIISYLC